MDVIHTVASPFKPTGGLRLLQGNVAPDGGAILKVAGVERNRFHPSVTMPTMSPGWLTEGAS